MGSGIYHLDDPGCILFLPLFLHVCFLTFLAHFAHGLFREERFWDAEQQCFWLRLRDEGDFGEQWLRKELLPPASTGLWENLREIKPICQYVSKLLTEIVQVRSM